jgi:hypothetical protein
LGTKTPYALAYYFFFFRFFIFEERKFTIVAATAFVNDVTITTKIPSIIVIKKSPPFLF